MCLRCETAVVLGRMISLCARRKFHGFFAYAGQNAGDALIWPRRRTHGARTQQSMNMFLDAAGIPGELAQQLS